MNAKYITCPKCKHEIPLDEAFSHRLREEMRAELTVEVAKRETKLQSKESELKEKEANIEHVVQEKIAHREQEIILKAKENAKQEQQLEIENFKQILKERDEKLEEMKNTELEIRKKNRQLEARQSELDLEVQRKVDQISENIRRDIKEKYHLKEKDQDKLISDLKQQIENLKQKADQGSAQIKGEVYEQQLEEFLTINFPNDIIEPVPNGKRGADVIQTVVSVRGKECGKIIWESKRSKNWNNNWIDKLKDDQHNCKADIGVILTMVLPKGITGFGHYEGVWVTNFYSLFGLTTAFRINLMNVAETRLAAEGKNEKADLLYSYLAGNEFKQRVEAIVSTFINLKNELDVEKRAFDKIWAKREKQYDRIIKNIGKMYGEMHAIIGASLPQIKELELKSLEEGE